MTGYEFKQMRIDLSLTQRELAEEMGISMRTVIRYEKNCGELASHITSHLHSIAACRKIREIITHHRG